MRNVNLLRLFWFIMNRTNPISEIDLLKEFAPEYRHIVRNGLTVELFHLHFRLYNGLYRLADTLAKTPWHLHIENMFVYMLPKPKNGRCRHFDDTNHSFCAARTSGRKTSYCPVHVPDEAEKGMRNRASSVRAYYLDLSNDNQCEAERIINISRGMLKAEKTESAPSTPLGYHQSNLEYSSDRLERRYWHMASTYEDVCTGFIGDFTEFNRAYSILSQLPSEGDRT